MAEGQGGAGGAAGVRAEAESSSERRTQPAMSREDCVAGIRSALKRTLPPPHLSTAAHHRRRPYLPPSLEVAARDLPVLTRALDPMGRSDGAVPEGADGEGRL